MSRAEGAGHDTTRAHLATLDLRAWQAEALAAWSESGRGVVEAVTGTGKTRLALAALRLIVDRGGRALVLVPTLELQQQWVRELRAAFADRRIGRLGGGHDDDLFSHEVVVATPHTAAQVPVDLPAGVPGLLVADEAHRYGAPTWAEALRDDFDFRLALTATYERADDGLVDVLEPYFGGVVHRYDFASAATDGTIAPFSLATVGVDLADDERASYEATDARVRALHRELIGPLGMPREPRKLLAAAASVVAQADRGSGDTPQVRSCREYLARVRERRALAATCRHKLDRAGSLAPALVGRRTLAFTDTIDQADQLAARLVAAGVAAETLHGDLERDRRRIRLALFRRGEIEALVAPRVLDEGIDVPDADVAVVLAAFRTRRQLVQRLGRVLRVKPDGREARLVLMHATATLEDPERGGHEAFLDAVRASAQRIDAFGSSTPSEHIVAWLQAR